LKTNRHVLECSSNTPKSKYDGQIVINPDDLVFKLHRNTIYTRPSYCYIHIAYGLSVCLSVGLIVCL